MPVRTAGYATSCINSAASVASTFSASALKLRINWPSRSPCVTLDAGSAEGSEWVIRRSTVVVVWTYWTVTETLHSDKADRDMIHYP